MKAIRILILVILFSFFLRLFTLNFNTAFTDEAFYIYVGRLVLTGNDPNTLGYMFGSYLAPVILASADVLGGLLAARFTSLIFSLVIIVFVYLSVKQLFNKKIALIASFIFSIQAPVIFISIFATIDSLSVCFFAISLYFFIHGTEKKKLLALSSLFLFMSFAAKYISIIFFPFMILYLIKKKVNPLPFILPAVILVSIYSIIYMPSLLKLAEIFNNMHIMSIDILIVALIILGFLLIPFLLSASYYRKYPYLIIAALIIPVYHLITINETSLYKHVCFSLLFLSPLMALTLNKIKRNFGIIIILFVFAVSMLQLNALQNYYPNTSKSVEWLRNNTNSSSILLTETAVYRYYLYDIHENIYDTYWFDYNKDGKDELIDYELAIKDRFFDFIVLDFSGTPEKSKEILNLLGTYVDRYNRSFIDSPIVIYSRDNYVV